MKPTSFEGSPTKYAWNIAVLILLSCTFLAGLTLIAVGEEQPSTLPDHAFPSSGTFGTKWKCERGYREQSGACVKIDIPEKVVSREVV